METVPSLEDSGDRKDSPASDSYIRAHLSEHAAACGVLADLVADPLFLLSADPERLLSVLDVHQNDVSPEIEHVYKCAFHHLKNPFTEAASYLEMTARKSSRPGWLTRSINRSTTRRGMCPGRAGCQLQLTVFSPSTKECRLRWR